MRYYWYIMNICEINLAVVTNILKFLKPTKAPSGEAKQCKTTCGQMWPSCRAIENSAGWLGGLRSLSVKVSLFVLQN